MNETKEESLHCTTEEYMRNAIRLMKNNWIVTSPPPSSLLLPEGVTGDRLIAGEVSNGTGAEAPNQLPGATEAKRRIMNVNTSRSLIEHE